MTHLTRLSLANRLIVGLITLAILGFGLYSVFALKQELLQPLGLAYAKQVLSTTPFERIEQYARAIQTVAENLRQEGLSPEAILNECRETLEGRLETADDGGSLSRTLAGFSVERNLKELMVQVVRSKSFAYRSPSAGEVLK